MILSAALSSFLSAVKPMRIVELYGTKCEMEDHMQSAAPARGSGSN
jgi:hypothetical protein